MILLPLDISHLKLGARDTMLGFATISCTIYNNNYMQEASVVLSITNNLEMIRSIWQDVLARISSRIREFAQILLFIEGLGSKPMQIPRNDLS